MISNRNPGRTMPARLLAVTGLAFALLGSGAQAQQPTEAELAAIKSNCRSDYMSNCMSVRPGGKEALVCLQQHMAKLSAACSSAVAATMPKAPPPAPAAAAPPPAAKPEPKPAAAAAPPPPPPAPAVATAPPPPAAAAPPPPAKAAAVPAVAKPKKEKAKAKAAAPKPAPQQAAVAPAPAAAAPPPVSAAKIEALPLKVKLTVFRYCKTDREAVCPGVRDGQGRVIVCLANNMSALSPGCRQVVAKVLQ